MNKSEIEDFKDMKNAVVTIANTVKNIDVTLNGDPKDHTSEGLVGAVNNNNRWKNNVNKWLGLFGVTTVSLLLKETIGFFKRGG